MKNDLALPSWKNDLFLLTAANSACVLLLSFRIYMTGSWYFSFLLWNLFLAFIPLALTWKLHGSLKWYVLLPMALMWLLFLPNAPYLITDLIHLRSRQNIPLWFDAMLLFSFAFAGNWMGLRSIERWMHHLKLSTHSAFVIMMFFLLGLVVGYGVFMGRVLRFNSWDLFSRPLVVLENAWFYLDDPRAVLMSCSFSVMITCSYYVYAKMKEDYATSYPKVS